MLMTVNVYINACTHDQYIYVAQKETTATSTLIKLTGVLHTFCVRVYELVTVIRMGRDGSGSTVADQKTFLNFQIYRPYGAVLSNQGKVSNISKYHQQRYKHSTTSYI